MNHQRGEQRWSAKLTEADVLAIRSMNEAGKTLHEIAGEFPQVSKVSVHHVIHRKRWKHVA